MEFVGEIGEAEKAEFLGGASALLFPVDWPEPFGLVMIEAMACGTPVIAFRRGSVPEVVQDGLSGFVVDTVAEAVTAVRRLASLDRAKVRAEFERRFTAERMARGYLNIYQRLADARARSALARGFKAGKAEQISPANSRHYRVKELTLAQMQHPKNATVAERGVRGRMPASGNLVASDGLSSDPPYGPAVGRCC